MNEDASQEVHPELIYKIFEPGQWETLKAEKSFAGSQDDVVDGFIHLSTWAQLPGTLSKHFSQQPSVFIAEIRSDVLSENLKWEVSRGGQKFPHFYGVLAEEHISRNCKITQNANSVFELPEWI